MTGDNRSGVGERLRRYLERIEKLREEAALLKQDEAAVFREAKSAGFDARTMREVLRWRAMTREEQEEREALFDTYRAALGMLGDMPLGAAALRRFMPAPDPDANDSELPMAEPGPATPTPEQCLTARAEGSAAALAGKQVLDNPYPAGDARRAAWDEGWCASSGSDGMDIPAAFRRSSPKKGRKGRDEHDGAGGAA